MPKLTVSDPTIIAQLNSGVLPSPWRKTTQHLAPANPQHAPPGHYDIYPGFPLGPGKIALGFDALAARLVGHQAVVIDGFGGVFWAHFRAQLDAALLRRGIQAAWQSIDSALKSESAIDALVAPFLGGDDPIFGTRFTGSLSAFYDPVRLAALQPDPRPSLNIVYGSGAALANWSGLLVYIDIPKNEYQFRSRARTFANLGATQPADSKVMYKRAYFVDWVALNKHKANLLPKIDLMIDGQRPEEPAIMTGADLRSGLHQSSHNYFRVRPWFEPGAWGGQLLKAQIPQLAQDAPNYAWSFELISPENGLAFESDGTLLEVSFDCLMFHDHEAILGDSAAQFGYAFPVRFDFLDTFDGGNLSVQCHPRQEYARAHFGEPFTQDETYYILACKPGAQVYLGFQEDIDPAALRQALENSQNDTVPIAIEHYVRTEAANPHDLFLIPSGTVHCSGTDVLVLEISATPYIFTFKMYDWMRLDLDGKPRPLNIARAFENLNFDRKGDRAHQELVSQPTVIAKGTDWKLIHLPTHAEHFYDIHRYEFDTSVEIHTHGSPHILSLVEGTTILLQTANGMETRFSYIETFVVPAAAGSYRLINEGSSTAKVIKCFMKPPVTGNLGSST